MRRKRFPLANEEYYHIFNRGVARMPVFVTKRDYLRFNESFNYYQLQGPKPRFSIFNPDKTVLDPSKKIVEIIAYCIMPNHFHFLLKQLKENGIAEFVTKLSNSYAKYYNIKNGRKGPLFEGDFKSVHVETNEQLIHLSRYIHLNPLIGYVTNDLETFAWSSYREYVGIVQTNICSKEIILQQFKSQDKYKQFILDQVDYARQLENIKHQLLER